MSKVVVGMSVSVDGIAGGTDPSNFMVVHEAVLGWVFDLRSWRSQQGMDGGADNQDSKIWAAEFERFGAQVLGRTMFDYGYPHWGETPPFHAPVFVVTHRAGERIEKQGGTSYTFVTDGIARAIEEARAAAGDKDVLVAGGIGTARQALAAGLVDELVLHVSPVVLGNGTPLLAELGERQIALRDPEVVAGEVAVHLRYQITR